MDDESTHLNHKRGGCPELSKGRRIIGVVFSLLVIQVSLSGNNCGKPFFFCSENRFNWVGFKIHTVA